MCESTDCKFRTRQGESISAGGGGDQEQLQGLSWASVIFYWGAVFMSILTLQKCIKFPGLPSLGLGTRHTWVNVGSCFFGTSKLYVLHFIY